MFFLLILIIFLVCVQELEVPLCLSGYGSFIEIVRDKLSSLSPENGELLIKPQYFSLQLFYDCVWLESTRWKNPAWLTKLDLAEIITIK